MGAEATDTDYFFEDTVIRRESTTRDLGVIVSKDLNTTENTMKTRLAALRSLWSLKRSFASWSIPIARKLYTSFVRPILEYATTATFPQTAKEELLLEGVQRLATRMVPELRCKEYSERCQDMNLFTLYHRRVRGDMILLYKILCAARLPDLSQLFELDNHSALRGHKYKLKINRSDKLPHVCRLSRRAPAMWNALPPDVVESASVQEFKKKLDDFLVRRPEDGSRRQIHLPGYPRGW